MAGRDDDNTADRDISRALVNAVESVIRGTKYGPPTEENAMLVDCCVVMGWSDGNGNYEDTAFHACSPWAAQGLLGVALRTLEEMPYGVDDGD